MNQETKIFFVFKMKELCFRKTKEAHLCPEEKGKRYGNAISNVGKNVM